MPVNYNCNHYFLIFGFIIGLFLSFLIIIHKIIQDNNKHKQQHATIHLSSVKLDLIHTIETNANNNMDSETPSSLCKEDADDIENKSMVDASYRRNVESDFRHVKQNILEALNRLSLDPTGIYSLPRFGYRMALVNDTIWIPLFYNHSIAVITLNDIEVKKIYFPGYTDLHPRAVLQVNEVDVLLASDKGLFFLNSTGHIQYSVAEGNFKDISKHDGKVIALQWVSQEEIWLHRLKYDSSKWVADKEHIVIGKIQIGYSDVTMAVYGESVYISSWSYDKIYKYTLGGVLHQTYGGEGSVVGELDGPHLSAVDPWGTVLVCDWGNARLQTLSAEGEWRKYRLGSEVRQPWDVIIVEKSLYILWWHYKNNNRRISQYNVYNYIDLLFFKDHYIMTLTICVVNQCFFKFYVELDFINLSLIRCYG